jgi:hypothetical protein
MPARLLGYKGVNGATVPSPSANRQCIRTT